MGVISLVRRACDYCGKNEDEVRILIVGLKDAAICNGCVFACMDMIEEKLGIAPNETPDA